MKKITCMLYFLIFILSAEKIEAQTINTLAGNGIAGFSGNGAAATSAEINMPHAIALDKYGAVYIADHDNNMIRKVDASGVITTIAGTGTAGYNGDGIPATSAQLNLPFSVAVDTFGNVYISDNTNHRLRKIDVATGLISTIAGNGYGGYTGDGVAATATEIQYPGGLIVDALGNIIFADQYNHRVRKIDASTGIISTLAGNGIAGFSGDTGPATDAELHYPNYVAVDLMGNFYVTDNGNQRIRQINTSGSINTIAGNGIGGYNGDGGMATSAELYYPGGIAVDNSGNLYIADYLNNRIRSVNPSGVITTVVGTGIAGYSGDGGSPLSADINNALDVKINSSGNLFIADYANNRIRVASIMPDHPPHFINGPTQNVAFCENSTENPIDSLLEIIDTDAGQTETWTLTTPPLHGTVFATYSTLSTGAEIIPSGLYYSPYPGYTGTDVFYVKISDGIATNETQINVTVNALPNAGIISGNNTVCPSETDTLSESVSGGIWSYSNIGITTISFSGVVTGVAPGFDTIIYTVVNSCGIASTIMPFIVLSDCGTSVSSVQNTEKNGIIVFPNPSANGEFSLDLVANTTDNVQYTITDVTGRNLKELTNITNKPIEIKLDFPGVYFVTAVTKQNKWTSKIIVNY